ncbi:MAG: hypothetical protein V8S87_03640 [Oscillospiraceae bacterium]
MKWSEQVKADPEIHIPVTVVGSITTIAEAEEIIASGKADMVAMARQLMCDNKLYNAYHGMEEKTRPCLRCHNARLPISFTCAARRIHASAASPRSPGAALRKA